MMPQAPQKYGGRRPQRLGRTSVDRPGGMWLHSWRWRQARKLWLQQHPECVVCDREGVINVGTDDEPNHVDHRVPHRGDYRLFWDESNWQTLCQHHHNQKTAMEDGGFTGVPTSAPTPIWRSSI